MLNMDEKILVKNLCNWTVGFKRIESIGDVSIPPKVSMHLSRGEIIAQCQSGNKLFSGSDGMGSHARIYITDKDTRVEVGFEQPDSKVEQKVLSEERLQYLYGLKTLAAFKKNVMEDVQSQGEKEALAEAAKRLKVNDYDKIKFVEEYTGFKVN